MSWFDRFLSRATLLLLLGAIVMVIAIPVLLQIIGSGVLPGSVDFSQYPLWIQVLLGFLGSVYLILEACILLGIDKKNHKRKNEKSV